VRRRHQKTVEVGVLFACQTEPVPPIDQESRWQRWGRRRRWWGGRVERSRAEQFFRVRSGDYTPRRSAKISQVF